MQKMEKHIKGISVLAVLFLSLFMAGNAAATDGTTFPVDDAGISAYVKVSESIDLHTVLDYLMPSISYIIETNPTYFIVNLTNDDNQITHLYVGADGWVIPYYLGTDKVSKVVRWNSTSSQYHPPQSVINMTTLEELIFKTCAAIGIDYETIKSDIKYYDFEHPDANRMMIAVDMKSGSGSDSFYMAIPSEVSVNESAYSHYWSGGYGSPAIWVNGIKITPDDYANPPKYNNYNLTRDLKNAISFNSGSTVYPRIAGVGWVIVYQT
jgi:hypothetical protein